MQQMRASASAASDVGPSQRGRRRLIGLIRQTDRVSKSYIESLREQLNVLEESVAAVVAQSDIKHVHWPDGFIGFAPYEWAESSPDLMTARMEALAAVRDFEPRFRLLFPHPTPEVSGTLKESFDLLRKWLKRGKSDHGLPARVEQADVRIRKAVGALRDLTELLPSDPWATRLVVDTNVLCDQPDLTVHQVQLGNRYMVHIVPVVFRELDDLNATAAIPRSARLQGGRTGG